VTLNISYVGVIYHACTSTHVSVFQSEHDIWSASFTDSKDMIGVKLKKTGHVTLTSPIGGGGAVCHRKASTWYILSAYKIWRLSLQPFRRHDCGRRNWKWVMWVKLQITPCCLSVVSVYQTAPRVNEVADVQLQLTTHLSTLKVWKAIQSVENGMVWGS